MTSISLNPPVSNSSITMQGQSQQLFNNIISSPNNQDSSPSSLSCRTLFNILDRRQTTFEVGEFMRVKDQQDDKQVYHHGSSSNNINQQVITNSSFTSPPQQVVENHQTTINSTCDQNLQVPLHKVEEGDSKNGHGSAKWVPSKVRLMKKMMMRHGSSSEDKSSIINNGGSPRSPIRFQNQGHSQRSPRSNYNNNGGTTTTRVCSDCNTSTTPLWRSGPNGPKSLCNACGIRQRKARRAMAEAAANNGLSPTMDIAHSTKTRVYNKDKKSRTNHFTQFKNKCKSTTTTTTNASSSSHQQGEITKLEYFKDFAINLRDNNSAFQQVFPRDEVAQAALLLMDLSCGFVH